MVILVDHGEMVNKARGSNFYEPHFRDLETW